MTRRADAGFGHPGAQHGRHRWVGVEQEFRVLDGDRQVDFRPLVASVGIGIGGLDPGDPRARRLASGALLTADGREAEVATPPVALRPGFTSKLHDHLTHSRELVSDALGTTLRLDGYSTHLNVEVPDRHAVRTARRFVGSFAPAMMLLLDRADSPGLLVRPRRGRVELCGEHVDGDSLRTASVFAAATTSLLVAASPPRHLRVQPSTEAATERYGWYVDRRAFGRDLYVEGRTTWIGDRTAGDQLARCWDWARDHALALADEEEIALVDAVVDGHRAIPLEGGAPAPRSPALQHRGPLGTPDPFGSVLAERRCAGLVIRPHLVTWDLVVLDLQSPTTTIHLAIPGRQLSDVLARLDRGDLDRQLLAWMADAPRLPVLTSTDRAGQVGAFRGITEVTDLVPGERDPLTGRIGGPGGPGSRRDKERNHHRGPTPTPGRPTPKPGRSRVLVAVGLVVALVAAGVAVAALAGDDDDPDADLATEAAEDPVTNSATGVVPVDAVRRPLTKDPCTFLGPDLVVAYVESFNLEYEVTNTPTPTSGSPLEETTSEAPAVDSEGFTRQCYWSVEMSDPTNVIPGASSGEVVVKLYRLSPFDLELGPEAHCSLPPFDDPEQLPFGDYAETTLLSGTVCQGDLQVSFDYNGAVSDREVGVTPEARAILEQAFIAAGDG